MHIAYLTHQYFPRHVGGTEVYTQNLARYAVEHGHQASIYTYVESPSGDPSDYGLVETEHEGIPVFELHYNLSVAPNPAQCEYNNSFVGNLLRDHLVGQEPDLVHATHLMKISGATIPAVQALDIPLFVTLTDYWAICGRHTLIRWNDRLCQGPAHRFDCVRCLNDLHGFTELNVGSLPTGISSMLQLARKTGKAARELHAISNRTAWLRETIESVDQIIVLSPFLKEMLTRNGFSGERLRVIPHGLDLDQATRTRSIDAEPKRAVFMGSLRPHKGVHILIEALRRIPDSDLILDIYGDIQEGDPYCTTLLEESRSDARIRWRGTFPPSELLQTVVDADALLVPSQWYENAPYVVQAALKLGVPVIASHIGSLIDMLDGRQGHILVDHDAVGAWSLHLEEFARGEPSYPVEKVDWPTMLEHADEVFHLYLQTLGESDGH